jgi:hypothetical protein
MGRTKDMVIELANKEIELQLIKEDFIGTGFSNWNKCAVEKAFKRMYNVEAFEHVDKTYIGRNAYIHDAYEYSHFRKDKDLAESSEDGTVIRTIKLTEVNNG